jgi:hypothetical protein
MAIHDQISEDGEISGQMIDIVSNVTFWFTVLITSSICIVGFFIIRRAEYHFSESIINNLRHEKYEQDYAKKMYIKKLEQMTKCKRSIAKFKRLYKLQNNFEVENYADKRMKEMVDLYKTNKQEKFKASLIPAQKEEKTKRIVQNRRERSRSFTHAKVDSVRMLQNMERNPRNPNIAQSPNNSKISENFNIEVNALSINPSKFDFGKD